MLKNKTRTGLLALALSATVLLGAASAVNLGITANNQLGAGTSVTATCQPSATPLGVAFDTPTYAAATQTFTVSTVNLSSVAASCNGKSVKIVVSNAAGASLATYSGTVSGTSVAGLLTSTVDSSAVGNVSVVIYG